MQSEKNSIEKADTLPVIALPVIVEGRYDKSAILGMFSANVITKFIEATAPNASGARIRAKIILVIGDTSFATI